MQSWSGASGESTPDNDLEFEHDHERIGHGINFFHIEYWHSIHSLVRIALKLTGLYWRGHKNSARIQLRHNHIRLRNLPSSPSSILAICTST